MELLFTEFRKGRAKFEKMFSSGVINPIGITKHFGEKEVGEILLNGSCKLLDDLDAIGEHFRKSWRTRYTGHKKHDFSSLQRTSSLNVQQFYADIIRAQKDDLKRTNPSATEVMVPADAIMDTTLSKAVLGYQKKIQKAVKSMLDAVCSNKEMKARVEAELKELKNKGDISEYKPLLDSMLKKLSDNIGFIDKEKKRIVNEADLVGWTMYNTGATYAISSLYSADLVLMMVPEIALLTAAEAALAFSPLMVTAGLGLILLVGAIALWCANEYGLTARLATIHAKRYVGRVQGKLNDIIKYTNDAEKFVRSYLRNKAKDQSVHAEITPHMIPVIDGFFKAQAGLWEPYTTIKGREYTEESKAEHGKHWSGLRKVRDSKQDTEIGSAKLALANTWKKIELDIDKFGNKL